MTNYDELHITPILLIDTTKRDETNIALVKGGTVKSLRKEKRAQELIELIDKLLGSSHLHNKDVRSIAILTGPGSFTGTRIGVVVANTWAWLNHLPIIVIPGDDFDKAIDDLIKGKDSKVDKVVEATY